MKDTNKKRRMRLPNGVGSVHLINDGKKRRNPWRARVSDRLNVDMETGKCTQKYITIGYYPTEKEAIAALFEYQRNPYTAQAATITFAEVYELWKAKKFPELSKSGQKNYTSAFKHSAALHSMKMRDIRTFQLEEVMQNMHAGYVVQSFLKTLWTQLFTYAMEHDIIQKNYATFVKLRDAVPTTTRDAIPPDDRAKIWDAANAGNHDAEIALIYIYTGLRANELLLMLKADVDLSNRIMVGGSKTKAGKARRIPIHKDILPFVERLMKSPGERLLVWDKRGTIGPISYNCWINGHWHPLMKQLGMNYTPHYARHTCATMLREANVAEDLRKLILGHANGDITNRYTHHPDAMLRDAIDCMPGNG